MKMSKLFKAALLGFAVSITAVPTFVSAETLRVMRGAASSALRVPMNRAVVVESDAPFAELSIANPGIADISTLSDRTIYVLGKVPGRTTLTLLGGDGKLITNVEVQVTPDVAEFKERLRQILPGEQIEVRTANDGIVLSGTVSSAARLDRALDLAQRYAPDRVSNLMVVGGTQQVMLKVRFAEMQRTVSKQLSGGITFNSSKVIAGGGSGGLTGTTTVNPATGLTSITNAFKLGTTSAGGVLLSGARINVLLEALETKGVVRTLAEPNLIALSGQEAKFLAGGEYPVPIAQRDNTISVKYKPFGIQLNFTPRVVDGDIINLSLTASVSSIDPANGVNLGGGFKIDAFKKRETTTTVEMHDGDSFAIAGLLQDDFRDLNNQVPWLGDIPILGTLFRSADYQRSQSELVIIITPHLVTPTRGEALALPTDRVRIPTEGELFLNGKVAGRPNRGPVGEVARQDFNGSYGYVME
ncbi:MAG TPA: type II and III secretion system protein family protein [Rhodobacteraceae bacterium]|nr:type II and III secretion system protein family protein [Paracoccaceae bacterium]